MNITTIVNEPKRGCGLRKPGGLYLRTDGIGHACGKLPLILTVCPCCGTGIKQARGWTWIGARALFKGRDCSRPLRNLCSCPLGDGLIPERAGLVWIGEKYYKRPEDWANEAMLLGISRRIPAIPIGFEIGKTLVLVAHPHFKDAECECFDVGIPDGENRGWNRDCKECHGTGKKQQAAIFQGFVPSRIEYIVKGDEEDEALERLEKRGVTLIKLVRTSTKEET